MYIKGREILNSIKFVVRILYFIMLYKYRIFNIKVMFGIIG